MTLCGTLIDTTLKRVRDLEAQMFGDVAATRDVVRRLLSEAQVVVSVGLELVTAEQPFAANPDLTLFNSDQQILRAHHNGFELKQCQWEELARADRGWLFREGVTRRIFSRIGVDLFALYPRHSGTMPADITLVVNLVPAPLGVDADAVVVPQEAEAALLNFTEALVMLRRRQLDFH